MKLDPIFTVKNNELYKIADDTKIDLTNVPEISSDNLIFTDNSFVKISIPWSKVELDDEVYNEEFLAALRDYLKLLDEKNYFAVIKPIVDKNLESPDQFEAFTTAFNHTARRIKDCVSVAGIELPDALLSKGFSPDSPATTFMETLAIKHAQYVYFADKSQGNTSGTTIVLY